MKSSCDRDRGKPYIRDIEPWFNKWLVVRKSKIHGDGLFAAAELVAGTELFRMGGLLFSLSERRAACIMPSTAVPLSEGVVIAERVDGIKDLSDYVNHSCEPNMGFRDAITLFAIRDIREGEELVIDYTFWEADTEWRLKQPCNCGTCSCRSIISGIDWQQIRSTDPKFEYLSPFLRRRILRQEEI